MEWKDGLFRAVDLAISIDSPHLSVEAVTEIQCREGHWPLRVFCAVGGYKRSVTTNAVVGINIGLELLCDSSW